MKFKIGDTVKILAGHYVSGNKTNCFNGRTGKIVSGSELDGFDWRVGLSNSIRFSSFTEQELELVVTNCHGLSYNSGQKKPASSNETQPSSVREFDTGATRNDDPDRLDYEGFLSPIVLQRYAEYLNKHRVQSDGKLRDSDNWQKGIPKDVYMKSKCRHFMTTWLCHRHYSDEGLEESLCAELFNTMGYLFEILKGNG